MAKTLTIQIKSVGEALEGFRETFKAYDAGRRVSRRACPDDGGAQDREAQGQGAGSPVRRDRAQNLDLAMREIAFKERSQGVRNP